MGNASASLLTHMLTWPALQSTCL